MKQMLLLAVALALAAATFSAIAASKTAAMIRAAVHFYNVAISIKQTGVPDAQARARLTPVISPGLDQALARSGQAEAAYAASAKGVTPPPLLAGDIFTSFYDGATSFTVEGCHTKGTGAECTVALSYDPKNDSHTVKPRRWTDRVELVRSDGEWRVDDIDYGGGWPDANKGTLRANLAFAIGNAGGVGR